MPKYVAFLRAINVGGHTVKMDALAKLFAKAGCAAPQTFIASGNVIFESAAKAPALEKKIAAHLEKSLGYAVATFLRTPGELAAIAAAWPFTQVARDAAGYGMYVYFLEAAPPAAAAKKLAALAKPGDALLVQGRECWWLRKMTKPGDFEAPPVEKALGMSATARNITTVRKLSAKYPPAGPAKRK